MNKYDYYFTPEVIEQIKVTLKNEPAISRRELSRRICTWLDWRALNGKLQDMSCRKAISKLAKKGLIKLPKAKSDYTFNNPPKDLKDNLPELNEVDVKIKELGELEVIPILSRYNKKSRIWNSLMDEFHPLGNGPLCGRQIRYLVFSKNYGWLGALSFSAATWHLKSRDKWIGWNEAAHHFNIQKVICNSRFLILPIIKVPNLASCVLSKSLKRLCYDWNERYGYEPVLVETFINSKLQHTGACYRAANWTLVGETAGRSTPYPNGKISSGKKDIYVYPIKSDWKSILCKEPEKALCIKPLLSVPVDWVEEEFGRVDFYDDRLKLRLYNIARDFFEKPGVLIPQVCSGIKSKVKGMYRFFSNPKVEMNTILKSHVESTVERIKEHDVILAVQDTTSFNYTSHPETKGLGPIMDKSKKTLGLLMHDTMAFTTQGIPLGLLDVQCWARDPAMIGKGQKRHSLPIEEKESFKWIKSYKAVSEVQMLCSKTMIVSVGDREADIYELFVEALQKADGPELLIRSTKYRNRHTEQGDLWEGMILEPVSGYQEIKIPKKGSQPERIAKLEVRYTKVRLKPPKNKNLHPIEIWAIYVCEVDYATEIELPLEWMLLTTVETCTFKQACMRIEWYTKRWGIEIYHRTLKSGCLIEKRQLRDIDRLKNCLAIDLVIAWRIYFLTIQGRQTPDISCEAFLSEEEWKVLLMYKKKALKSHQL